MYVRLGPCMSPYLMFNPLPPEVGNRALRLGQNRRREWRIQLGDSSTEVLRLLQACLSSCSGNSEISTKVRDKLRPFLLSLLVLQFFSLLALWFLILLLQVFACLGSWVQLGGFSVDGLAQSPLMVAPFQTLVRKTSKGSTQ